MNIKTKRCNAIILVFLLLFSAGCIAAPQHNIADGIDKAVGKSEETAATPVPTANISEETPDRVDTVISGNTRSLTINADVTVPDSEKIYTARLIPASPDEVQKKKLLKIFWGDEADKSFYDSQHGIYYLSYSAPAGDSSAAAAPDKTFAGTNFGRLEYCDTNLCKYSYYETYYDSETSNPKTLQCAMTQMQAIDALKSLYSEISDVVDMGDLNIANVASANDNITNLGSWDIIFSPIYFGIPFVPNYCLPSGMYTPQEELGIGDNGIIRLYGRIMYCPTETTQTDILSLNQILALIPGKLGTEIGIPENTEITDISLRYIVDWGKNANTWTDGTLVPVWFFSTEAMPTMDDTEFPTVPNYAQIPITNVHVLSEKYFLINAITGETII